MADTMTGFSEGAGEADDLSQKLAAYADNMRVCGKHGMADDLDAASAVLATKPAERPFSVRDAVMCAIENPAIFTPLFTKKGCVEHHAHWQARAVLMVLAEKGLLRSPGEASQ